LESCSDIVGLILAEAHYRLVAAIEWLDSTITLIDSIGLGLHLLGYMMIIIMLTIMLTVWRMTRSEASIDL